MGQEPESGSVTAQATEIHQQQTIPLPIVSRTPEAETPPLPLGRKKYNKVLPKLGGLMLVVAAVAWMAGILLDSWVQLPVLALLIGTVLPLVGVVVLRRSGWGMLVSLVMLCLSLGTWRYASVSPAADPRAISRAIGTGKVEVRGTVADEPKMLDRSSLLLVAVSGISTNAGSSWQDAHGQLEVQIAGASIDNPYGPNYGDDVELRGKVQPPFPHGSPETLASMSFPVLNVVGSGGNPVIAALLQLRLWLATIITQSLPQPVAALLIAILLSCNVRLCSALIAVMFCTGHG